MEPNKTLPHPFIEGEISDFDWSEKSVDNIIDAIKKGYIEIERTGQDTIKIRFLPLKSLPKNLGQVSELSVFKQNLQKGDSIYGDASNDE